MLCSKGSAKWIVFYMLIPILVQSQKLMRDMPNVTVTFVVSQPKGFRAQIYVDADVNFLFFDGILMDLRTALKNDNQIRQIWGAATLETKRTWVFKDPETILKIGEIIKYAIFLSDTDPIGSNETNVSLKFNGRVTDYRIFKVTDLVASDERTCIQTVTKIRGRNACAGRVIFEDNFNTLREDLWQIEQFIPMDHPEHPFVSYQRLSRTPTVFVENGYLNIVPQLQENSLTGTLDLRKGCTRSSCFQSANGANILPPIVSGRMTSIPFAFKYGRISLRAKLPQGHWIYPEILLDSTVRKYGDIKDLSGVLKVAMAGGNRERNFCHGNQYLKGALLTSISCDEYLHVQETRNNVEFWGDDFHEYSMLWTPDEIVFYLDNIRYTGYDRSEIKRTLQNLLGDENIVNYDDYLHLVLGVAVGGIVEFPDVPHPVIQEDKPWRNGDHKAAYKFWQDRHTWCPTWTNNSRLIIDYIKVTAI